MIDKEIAIKIRSLESRVKKLNTQVMRNRKETRMRALITDMTALGETLRSEFFERLHDRIEEFLDRNTEEAADSGE